LATNYFNNLISPALKSLFPVTSTAAKGAQSLYNYGKSGNTSNTANQGTSMRDYLGGYGITPGWSASSPNSVTIGQNTYKVGSIPGTSYDPNTSQHYITDKNAFSSAAGLNWDQGSQTQTSTGATYPPLPPLNYDLPDVETISWDEALTRAKSRYEPEYKSAVLTRDKMAQDQRDRLAQMLGARGYGNARGGQMQVGQGNITQEQAMALESLRNQYDSAINQYASDIYTQESTGAQQKLSNLFEQQKAQNQDIWKTWNTNMNAAMGSDTEHNNLVLKIVDYLESLEGGS